jgi:hypothetical protein
MICRRICLEFSTDKFMLTGPLPDHINAGNQFYGEDVAKWLCETLPQWNLTYLDEDWGWLVWSSKDNESVDERNMICVYAYPASNPGASDFGHWMFSILTEYKSKWFGFLTRWKSGLYNPSLAKDVIAALEKLGVQDVRQTEV